MDRVEKEGLLHIPKTARDANQPLPSTGIVVKLGEELMEEFRQNYGPATWPLSEGAMVMFSRFAGTDFRVDTEDFRILDETEIMCTLRDVNNVVTPVVED